MAHTQEGAAQAALIQIEAEGAELDTYVSEDYDFDRSTLNLATGQVRNLCPGRGITTYRERGAKMLLVRIFGREVLLQMARRRNTLTGRSLGLVRRLLVENAAA